MYLKNLALRNIGPINELQIELPFYQNEPVPIIFVGENGTGKTVLISQIVDAIYEVANQLFNNILPFEGMSYKYYKISGGINLSVGCEQGFSIVTLIDQEENKIEYFDKVGLVTKEEFKRLIPEFSLSPNNSKSNQKATTQFTDLQKEVVKHEFNSNPHFYQPAYRYEEPFWKNNLNTDVEDKSSIPFEGIFTKEIEILTSTQKNKQYLLDLIIDFSINPNVNDTLKMEPNK